jgi:hypothetical protein
VVAVAVAALAVTKTECSDLLLDLI